MAPNDRLASRLGIITGQENDFRPFKMDWNEMKSWILVKLKVPVFGIISSQNVTIQWFYFVNCRLSFPKTAW